MGNYSFKTTGLPEPVNGVIEGHNFTQGAPHTPIYIGLTGLHFVRCNLTNCDVPENSEIENCCTGHVSFCSHLHPKWLAKRLIVECADDCDHVVHTDIITVDGMIVETNQYREDIVEV